MPNRELETINAVLKNKDVGVMFASAVDDMLVAYGDVWESIKGYYNKYHAIPDLEIIQGRFPDLEEVPINAPTAYYVDELKTAFIDNKTEKFLLKAADSKRQGDSPRRVYQQLMRDLSSLSKYDDTARDLNVMDMTEAERHYEEVRARAEALGGTPGIPTGVSFIDSAYPSGLAGGDLIIVLGWTGRAKSLFTTLVSCNAHDLGYKPMITSLEMSGEKVRDRIWTIKGSGLFTNSGLALGDIHTDDLRSFESKQAGKPEFIVVSNDGSAELTPNVMQAKIDQHKPSMVTFDYAQLGTDNENSQDMTARMRNMSKQYKRLAVHNDIPVILISSATADSSASSTEPPRVEQVAWSKQLAFDADLAFAVHKYDDSDIVEIVARKNRNGPLFNGYLDWNIDRGIIQEKFEL